MRAFIVAGLSAPRQQSRKRSVFWGARLPGVTTSPGDNRAPPRVPQNALRLRLCWNVAGWLLDVAVKDPDLLPVLAVLLDELQMPGSSLVPVLILFGFEDDVQ